MSNGPLKPLGSKRAQVTGHLVALDGPGCKVPLTSATIEVPGCRGIPICSASIVRDSTVAATPFVLSAAHCFADDLEYYDKVFCRQKKLPAASLRSYGLYFYSQASKKLIRLGRPVNHPSYRGTSGALTSSRMHDDIAVVNIAPEELSRVSEFASIEKNVPRLTPEATVFEKLLSDVAPITGKSDALTHFVTSFPLSAFDKAPIAELIGGGMVNNGTGLRISRVEISEKDCQEFELDWSPLGCLVRGRTGIANVGSQLRSVRMRVAYSSPEKALVIFVPRKEFPKEGTCKGDSGGPSFLGDADSTAVYAVESCGPQPCAGAPTIRTIVAPHTRVLGEMLKAGLQAAPSCR
ncbi:MAG: hypothetical protein FJY29_04970 [Betaproteobacteria bacterium]|nr:hypothetical protein [Betaproteobacteria bacterium]